jgi:hypothetical protein
VSFVPLVIVTMWSSRAASSVFLTAA